MLERKVKWMLLMKIGIPVGIIAMLLIGLLTLATIEQDEMDRCGGSEAHTPTGPTTGGLGGIGGSGVTPAEFQTVASRGAKPPRITPGQYETTAYGPPWGGINGAGIATSAGLRLNGGAPAKYFVAVDPSRISYGAWVYIWPNPFNWQGAFLAADTGGAIRGNRIDFYDWRGRATQLMWGRKQAQVSATAPAGSGGAVALTPVVEDSTCGGSATAGTLTLPTSLSAAEVAAHPLVTFTGFCARQEIATGWTDPRIIDVLGAIAESGRAVIVTALACDHSAGTNHRPSDGSPGRAIDIGSVAGKVCNPYGPDDACGKLAIELSQMSGKWKSGELIASFDPNPADGGSWADPVGHVHHIHLGYDA